MPVHVGGEQVLEVGVFQQRLRRVQPWSAEAGGLTQPERLVDDRVADDLLGGAGGRLAVGVGQVLGDLDHGDEHLAEEHLVVAGAVPCREPFEDERLFGLVGVGQSVVAELELAQVVDAAVDDSRGGDQQGRLPPPRLLQRRGRQIQVSLVLAVEILQKLDRVGRKVRKWRRRMPRPVRCGCQHRPQQADLIVIRSAHRRPPPSP